MGRGALGCACRCDRRSHRNRTTPETRHAIHLGPSTEGGVRCLRWITCRRDRKAQAQPKSLQPPSKCLLARSFLPAELLCFWTYDEDAGRSGLGEAARLREGSAGAAHGWAAIRFPWPWMDFGMRIALPSTGELPPARRPGG